METKKSHKADLERRRPLIFTASLAGVTLLLAALMEISIDTGDAGISPDALDIIAQDMELVELPPADEPLTAVEEETPEALTQRINITDEATTDEEDDSEGPAGGEEAEDEELPDIADMRDMRDTPAEGDETEHIAEFPGGMSGYVRWLTDNLRYPAAAAKRKIEGKVTVAFTVDTDGSVSDIRVVTSADDSLDKETLRVMALMPHWKPGESGGRPCRTMIVLPVVFAL